MTGDTAFHVIYLLAALALVGSSFVGARLGWKTWVRMGLIWAAIFAGVTALFMAFGSQ